MKDLGKQTFESEPQEQVWTTETCLPGRDNCWVHFSARILLQDRRVPQGAKELSEILVVPAQFPLHYTNSEDITRDIADPNITDSAFLS